MSRRSTVKGGGSTAWPGTSSQLTSGAGGAVNVSPASALASNTLTVGGWQTTYEVDFTSLTPVASYSNGTATIDGKTWTFSDLSANATASLSVADGLKLTAAAGGSYNPVVTGPALSSLGATPLAADMLVWTRLESTISTSGGTQSLVSNWLKNAAETWLAVNRVDWAQSTGIFATFQYFYVNATAFPASITTNYTTGNLTHDVRVIRAVAADHFEVWSGAWSSGWPSLATLQYRGWARIGAQSPTGGGASLTYPNPNDVYYALAVQSVGATSAATIGKLKALRVQAR